MSEKTNCERCVFKWVCMESVRVNPCPVYTPKKVRKTENREEVKKQICAVHEFLRKEQERT